MSIITLELLSGLPWVTKKLDSIKRIYLILSIDAESDIYTHKNLKAGWETGVPFILDVFSEHGLDGKACWLVEFNIRDRLIFANPDCSERFVPNFEDIIGEIKRKGHEFGLHPTVYEWSGDRWDYQRPLKDSAFVSDIIHQGNQVLVSVCKQKPIGCRTSNFHFAQSLAAALETEGYLVDSSCRRGIFASITAPNAWFAGKKNYRFQGTPEPRTRVLEIPTTDYVRPGWNGALSLKYKPNKVKTDGSGILFLSAFLHNWDAVTTDGKRNPVFEATFEKFINLALENSVEVVSFTEAYRIYETLKR